MRVRPLPLLAVVAVAATSCVAVPKASVSEKSGSVVIPAGQPVCVTVPADGAFAGKPYAGSGDKVGEKTAAAVRQAGFTPRVLPVGSTADACRAQGLRYQVAAEILNYENRASGWNGAPDRISVRVSASDLDAGVSPASFLYSADSNTLASAFLEYGNAAPHQLLGGEYSDAVVGLVTGK